MNTVHRESTQTQDWLTVSEGGEIRRLTMLFADLVGSTSLSARVDPETYRTVVGRYRQLVENIVNEMQGYIGSTKGDGLFAVFGHPVAHEDDAQRAVVAGLRIVDAVAKLSEQSKRRFGFGIEVRVGVHRGEVYLHTPDDDVFGCEPAFTQLVSALAEPMTVVVSDAVSRLIGDDFDLQARRAATVPGVDGPIGHHRVLAQCPEPHRGDTGPLVGRRRERARLTDCWAQLQAG